MPMMRLLLTKTTEQASARVISIAKRSLDETAVMMAQ